MKPTKKEFALSQIAPYYNDPKTCGYENGNCMYLTSDGKMCVAGKNMIDPSKMMTNSILGILDSISQKRVFKPESVGILSNVEWMGLQFLHDSIAKDHSIEYAIERLELFTMEELKDYANKIKS